MMIPMMFGACVTGVQWTTAATNYIVHANNGAIYLFYIDGNTDVSYKKSTDGGVSWSSPVVVYVGAVWQLALWYGRWSDRADDKIYLAYSETTTDDILFRTVDTGSSDALGTQTVVFAGASTANGGTLSIVIAKGGNIVVAGYIDAGAEGGAYKSTDSGATWAAAIANPMEAVSADMIALAPGWNADTQDVMMFFWDASANEISVKRYDDSANTWTETSIATSMSDVTAATFGYPMMSVAVDIANSQNIVAAWSTVGTVDQDLRLWTVTTSTITEKTNVVLNAVANCAFTAITIDTVSQDWYVFFCGNPAGGETLYSSENVWYKVSTDDGATWSAATKLTNQTFPIRYLISCPRYSGNPVEQFVPVFFQTQETTGEFQNFTLLNLYKKQGGTITIS